MNLCIYSYIIIGGGISGITISRFFALHVVALPLILIALVFLHLVALHEVGAGNPEGVDIEES